LDCPISAVRIDSCKPINVLNTIQDDFVICRSSCIGNISQIAIIRNNSSFDYHSGFQAVLCVALVDDICPNSLRLAKFPFLDNALTLQDLPNKVGE
ncbi:hypothetical protein, partial [Enterocloster citroniae]|uniref:hypothetical protein n=1 Tax=Enterocloster citroniae TaxID=358743 RepID=UPI001D14E1E3